MKKLLVLEFNELCPDLIERFIKQGNLPNFQRLKKDSVRRETITDAAGGELNPWIQWVDVHTGKERKEHGIYRLNEINRYKGEFTWDILAKRLGVKSWICGSMNASYSTEFLGRFLPDPWTQDVSPHPKNELDTYYNFVSQAVQGHSKKAKVSSFDFVKDTLKHGITLGTIFKLAKQIASEKIFKDSSWKRAMILDWIQLDLFAHYYKKDEPQYATFFSNAVAHYQHHYWREFEPELFGLSAEKVDKNKADAIYLAYKNTDALLGRLLDLIGSDTSVIFVTPLSQQPYTKNERYYYHISNEKDFFKTFCLPAEVKYRAVMAEQFQLHAKNEQEAKQIVEHLSGYEMDSNEHFHVGSNSLFLIGIKDNVVYVQCRCTKDVVESATFFGPDKVAYKFYDHFYQMDEVKAGCHSPRGIYWFRNSQGNTPGQVENVPPTQIHKDILQFFGL